MDAAARWRAPDCADTDSYMNHFYRNVPKLGNVAVSRHAQNRMEEGKISHEAFGGRPAGHRSSNTSGTARISSGANATEYGL